MTVWKLLKNDAREKRKVTLFAVVWRALLLFACKFVRFGA